MNAVHPSPRPGARSTAACGLALLLLAGSATARTNRFSDVYTGAEVAGGTERMDLTNNTFVRNYGQAIVVGFLASGGTGGYRPGTVALRDNTIAVPADPLPGGQVRPTAEVVGIQLLALPNGGKELVLENNEIQGRGGNPAKPQIGFDAQLCFDYHYVQRQNQFVGLDAGIRLMDAGGNTSHEDYVTDNYFTANIEGVELTGGIFASLDPVVSCNTFEDNQTAISITPTSTVSILSGPNGTGPQGLEPVANKYGPSNTDLDNMGAYLLLYVNLDSPLETPTYSNSTRPPSFLTQRGTPCDQRPRYGPGVYGLQRPAAGAASTAQWQQWQERLTRNDEDDQALYQVTMYLLDYAEQANQLPQLEAFANTLPMANDAAFDRLSIYLMERYRRLGQPVDARRVRDNLVFQHGTDRQMADRVAYFDLAGNLAQLAPGARPGRADSTRLRALAAARTDFAPVACATLRYFYPTCECQTSVASPTQNRSSQALATAKLIANSLRPAQVQAYPNPAHDRLTVKLTGPCPAHTRVELLELSTGRVLLTVAVANATAELRVAELAAGVYAGRAISPEGQVLGTCKAVVIH